MKCQSEFDTIAKASEDLAGGGVELYERSAARRGPQTSSGIEQHVVQRHVECGDGRVGHSADKREAIQAVSSGTATDVDFLSIGRECNSQGSDIGTARRHARD